MHIYVSLVISHHMKTSIKPTHCYQFSETVDGLRASFVVSYVVTFILLPMQKNRDI